MSSTKPLTRAAFTAAAAAAIAYPRPLRAQALTSVATASAPEDSVTALLWAQKTGMFRRRGLDIQITAQRSGSVVAAAVAGGSFAIGKASVTAIIAAHIRGVPFVMVAPSSIYVAANPNTGLLVKADSPIRTGADLNGKTVAVGSINDLYTIGTRLWMDQHGGDSSTVKIIELPLSSITEALVAGRIDAGALDTPSLTVAIESGKTRLLSHMEDAFGVNFLVTAWFTTADYYAKNLQVVRGFASALHESALYVNVHHAETVDLIAAFTQTDPAVISKMGRVPIGTSLDARLIQPVIDASARYKVIPHGFDAQELIPPGLA